MAVGNSLGKLLGKSPLKPLQEHMRMAAAAVHHLGPLVEAARADDWKQAASQHKQVLKLAADADKLKRLVIA